ncbi:hypothetical protein QE152_g30001 [Popillia japonica]|uniref:Uncharacterized protein n=1 Tax=Popillia japonica TaxID=7064 RepID=A0AAW1JF33_POPJA
MVNSRIRKVYGDISGITMKISREKVILEEDRHHCNRFCCTQLYLKNFGDASDSEDKFDNDHVSDTETEFSEETVSESEDDNFEFLSKESSGGEPEEEIDLQGSEYVDNFEFLSKESSGGEPEEEIDLQGSEYVAPSGMKLKSYCGYKRKRLERNIVNAHPTPTQYNYIVEMQTHFLRYPTCSLLEK